MKSLFAAAAQSAAINVATRLGRFLGVGPFGAGFWLGWLCAASLHLTAVLLMQPV